jgi:8-amino-7-oxononanoate synthase
MTIPFSHLEAQLTAIKQQGLYRNRRVTLSPQGIIIDLANNKTAINFCSNDYLGLANHHKVITAFQQAANQYGVGSGSAHLICGHNYEHHALEEELAHFTGRERALLFSTGYMANLGIITALLDKNDSVFEDKLNHASLLDGGLFSKAKFKRYAHASIKHLDNLLINATGNKLIVSDGVFSMDGDVAPLKQLAITAKHHHAWLMVDDAHGLGVLGNNGGGLLEQCALNQDDVAILMGTLGKAFGTFGAFVAGSELLIETLIQKSRSYIYTTALPPAVAAATRASLKLIQTEPWRRQRLSQLISYFKTSAAQHNLTLMPSLSPIQPIMIGNSEQAVAISNALLDKGFLVSAIRPPTVPQGSARLRVTLSALHTEAHIDGLMEALGRDLN